MSVATLCLHIFANAIAQRFFLVDNMEILNCVDEKFTTRAIS